MFRNIVVAAALLAVATTTTQAQERVELELRAGGAFPTADMGNASLKPGAGGEFLASYRLLPHLHVYAGWDYYQMKTDTPLYGSNYDVENTGYAFGMKFRHPMLNDVGGWVRAGGIYSHIELESGDNIIADSGHELGWEVGGGLHVPVGTSFAITPGVRYRALSGEVTLAQVVRPVDLNFIAAEIGVTYTFGGGRSAVARTR
jgi:hypothetical protein